MTKALLSENGTLTRAFSDSDLISLILREDGKNGFEYYDNGAYNDGYLCMAIIIQ